MRSDVEKHNSMVDKNLFELAADPTKPFKKPEKKEAVPYLDFTPLQNALADLKTTIAEFSVNGCLKTIRRKKKCA